MALEPEKNRQADSTEPPSDAGPISGKAALDDDGERGGETEESPQADNRRARRAAAARARKERLRERREAEAVGLDAQEILDDALVRSTDKVGKWLRRNFSLLQWLLVAGVVGWASWGGYGLYMANATANASDAVADAISLERGRVGDTDEAGQPDEQGIVDPTPIFKDDEARLAAAREAFTKSAQARPGSGTALYAQLGLAAVLFDQGKLDEAKEHFEKVKGSSLAAKDPELKGRAEEGIALILEAKGQKGEALARYVEMAKSGVTGFAQNALYQQARLQHELGKSEEAKAALKKLADMMGEEDADAMVPSYLRQRVEDLAQVLDPELAEKLSKPPPLTPERLKQLEEQMKKAIANSKPADSEGTGGAAPESASPQPNPTAP